ncbi:MalY/PatB family protein [Acuticoccus mangrovi]|uniref:cysteine-S-conjugate beta-lyase n=1 Tax=Acuticoccus mangrovi TaxID=2796142 RepID=A0A934IHY0_9HYPH|nr:aminotransferase class I/II-fold pyridoxal phosphate-dependent enzyme [Acuticoccus mangrovi]MBJ3776793.1 aminotransferase class I/II-fold pyridoxal phosphate-dependent enzyme [Acuticoccus mangrovi]
MTSERDAHALATTDFDLDLSEDQLRTRRNVKWSQYPADVLPAFVAEMDFAVAPPIQAALERVLRQQDYGYPKRDTERPEYTISESFAARMQRLYGWTIAAEEVQPLADLVQAKFAAITAFSDPGDGVIVQVPAYSPFFDAVETPGRVLKAMRMVDDGTGYVPDLDALRRLAPEASILTICNPHNPTGRAFTKDELLAMAQVAIEHDLVIVSDEIHSDLTYEPFKHIPIASLSPEIAARTVTINSPTKSFNIPGLRAAVMHFGTMALKERFFARVPRKLLGQVGVFGIEAANAAWREGTPWLLAVKAALADRRARVVAALAGEPGLKLYAPEATYMAWLDCSGLRLNVPAQQFFVEEAKVGFSGGSAFDPDAGSTFVRVNFATSAEILDRILDRTLTATRKLTTAGHES